MVSGFFHEYMVSQPMQDNLVYVIDGGQSLTSQRRERHLSVQHDKLTQLHMGMIDFSLLRSLTVFVEWDSRLVPCKMVLLQVLDLEDAVELTDDELSSIKWKWLPRLKFLSLRGCQLVSCLPSSLFGLEHLETLDVKGTSIAELPRGINKLQKLQCLRVGRAIPLDDGQGISTERSYNYGVVVPLGIVGKLKDLHTIGVVNVGAAGGKAVLKNLRDYTGLRKLGVSGINPGNMRWLSLPDGKLSSLSVRFEGDIEDYSGLLHDVRYNDHLSSLKLYGPMRKFPAECIKKFENLRKLTLEMCMLAAKDMKVIRHLHELSVLRLFFNQFQGDKLNFKLMSPLKVLEVACKSRLHVTFKKGWMDELEVLKVDCSSGTQISDLENLSSINQVCLRGSFDEILEEEVRRQIGNLPGAPALTVEWTPIE
ncbi:unnamed protein product [Triticum turgidum subsp. durum]|uniref:Disease resistance R13L4/SHOC-2-like LRR domain-containing protein n=1 Tax=Triticum turgidum subsp. durum TaxID=4567 RepID=A0A9R1Q3W7_TRITD|nr:unnamed protein product [Triticum turgidum subsp. durum]